MIANHTIRLTTRDGESLTFNCREDQNLVDAAENAKITLPAICREGNCGACHGSCQEGDYEHGAHSEDALSKDARSKGEILMCRTFPKSDLSVEVPSDLAHLTAGPAAERECVIAAVQDMGGQVIRLVLRLIPDANGDLGPSFEPGQFMELQIPGTDISRAYSLANAPNWEGTLEFLIRLQPQGKFSTWLATDAKEGGTIHARGPEGSFVLKAGSLKPRCFVAGGTGIAPMLSMLRQMAAFGETNDARLYFGVNTEDDLFGLDDIADLKAALPNLKVEVCVWKPKGAWHGFTGSPVDAFVRNLNEGLSPEVYLCGPPGLVDATEATAEKHGVPHDQVFCERFLPS